jgi:DNA-binding SARP family transcriptional activator
VEPGESVQVAVLGELRAGGRVLGPRDLGGRKPKQVLEALLVHQGHAVPKDRLVDLVWGERLPADPMRTLEAYVSVLRDRLAVVEPDGVRLVRSQPRAYRVALDGVGLDLRAFDDLVSRAGAAPAADRLRLRERALALVRGELLADEPYTEWIFPLRELYAERRAQVLLDAAEDCLVAGRPQSAVGYAEQVLAGQPTRERAHRLLVAARYACGEQDLALAAYRRCLRVLDEELGVRPLPETERVFRAVLNQDPVETVTPAARTPAARTPVSISKPPQTRFARSGEATIAYQVVGEGPVDMVFAHAWFSHMEVGWEEPRYAAFLRRLAEGPPADPVRPAGHGDVRPGSTDGQPGRPYRRHPGRHGRRRLPAGGGLRQSRGRAAGDLPRRPGRRPGRRSGPVRHVRSDAHRRRLSGRLDTGILRLVPGRARTGLGHRPRDSPVGAQRGPGRGADGVALPPPTPVGQPGRGPGDPRLRRHPRRP